MFSWVDNIPLANEPNSKNKYNHWYTRNNSKWININYRKQPDNNLEKEVKEKMIKAGKTAGCLNRVRRNKYIKIEARTRIYESLKRCHCKQLTWKVFTEPFASTASSSSGNFGRTHKGFIRKIPLVSNELLINLFYGTLRVTVHV